MDVQLQELIDKIKTEGVEEAQRKSEQLIEDAQREAERIVAEANARADKTRSEAEAQAERSLQSGRDALTQAARDLLIGLKQDIHRIFSTVIEHDVSGALSGDLLEQAILKSLDTLGDESGGDISIALSTSDAEALTEGFKKRLAETLQGGVEVSPSPRINAGFQVSVESGTAHYDFTPEEIASVLASFLNPKLAEILRASSSAE